MLSENTEDTGSFFGRIDGTIMDSLVQDRIYRRVALMDYQGACSDNGGSSVAAGETVRPTVIKWLFDYAAVLGMSWLTMLPGSAHAWPQRFENEYEDSEVDMDDYSPENYDLDQDYNTNDVVTNPEIVSDSDLRLFNCNLMLHPPLRSSNGQRTIPRCHRLLLRHHNNRFRGHESQQI